MAEKNAPWRDTPLDHWSTDIDPAIMVGDEWVQEGDPGVSQAATKDTVEDPSLLAQRGRFMHPQHDVTRREGK